MVAAELVNILLLILSVVLFPSGPDDAGKMPEIDMLGPAGYEGTLVLEEEPGEVLQVYRKTADGREKVATIQPMDEAGMLTVEHASGSSESLNLMELMESGREALSGLTMGGAPVSLTVAGQDVRCAMRAGMVYVSAGGSSYVTRMP